ncbi:hypothetical protein [Caproicibacter fermentans]|uniref:Uncharacterized protein n=1 Tax=Caproicibacter fermentans TaxID=2576756 RepID=A0A7G8T966_9FIRM|nr:hypothetical protein [Caproicibacter fermentans]QNK40157.1 hypothetical protein HCR03_15935 [Caproicibacter fermentans]
MQTAIGILMILAGIAGAVFMMKKAERRAASAPPAEPIRPVPIEEAVEALNRKLKEDPGARLSVELYGLARTDLPAVAPVTERPAACYKTVSYSCREKSGGQRRGFRSASNLEQTEEYRESGPDDFYIMDSTSDEKIYVDLESFGDRAELLSACDSYEEKNSKWMDRHLKSCRRFFPRLGSDIAGYHVLEYFYHVNQPLNIAGDLYRHARRYRIAASSGKKRSLVTYKSEEQAQKVLQKSRLTAVGLGLIAVVVGIGVIIAGFR